MVTIAASRAFSRLRKLSWMVHVLLVGTWPSRSCVIDSAMSNNGGVPLPQSGVRPCTLDGAAPGGVRRDLMIMLRASSSGVPHPSSTPQPAGVSLDRAGTSAEQGTPPVSFGAPPDDQMSIAASEGSLSFRGWHLGYVAPFGCGSVVRVRSRDDGYAFSGRRECLARVESSTASQSFEVERVVSQCHSSLKCMRSLHDHGRHLSLPEKNLVAPPLSPPRWWSCFGVHGHHLCGAVSGHATKSNCRHHSVGWAVSPLTDL